MNKKKDLGLYIHIPFCKMKCYYCDFLSAPQDGDTIRKYIEALHQEIESLEDTAKQYIVKTIYFGGGTPSVLEPELFVGIINDIYKRIEVADNAEITVECNPGTLNREKVIAYRKAGINRISLGLQSANNEELKSIGRIHTYEEFVSSYDLLQEVGFDNISVDVMSALPYQTIESYKDTLSKVISLNPKHISSYSLILEEGTRLEKLVESGKYKLCDEVQEREMYYLTNQMLEAAGYNRYEISNYAQLGFESKHNSSYWIRTDYLGMGLGASSFINGMRFHNEEDLYTYIQKVTNTEDIRIDKEIIDKRDAMEEFVFLGLRMMKGISASKFQNEFGEDIWKIFGTGLNKVRDLQLCEIDNDGDNIRLTDKGVDVSNYVFREIFC